MEEKALEAQMGLQESSPLSTPLKACRETRMGLQESSPLFESTAQERGAEN
jgi:hypothetical protein